MHLAWIHTDFEHDPGWRNGFRSEEEIREAYAKMDHIVCVSRQTEQGFRKKIGDTEKLSLIPNLLPVREIQTSAEEAPAVKVKKAGFHIVLAARFMDYHKGQRRLINAVCRLRNEGADISFALVGTGRDRQMFANLIKENEAEEYITMVENQVNPYPYIKEADLLVCAS